jgi:hypothetical protein
MAIGTTPLFSKISGSAGPVDFRTRRNGKIEIGKKRIPANPQSTRQLEVRAGYGRLHELWQNAPWIDKNPINSNAKLDKLSSWNEWLKYHLPIMSLDPAFYWPCVEGTNNTVHNITKNISDGTIYGMLWNQLNSKLWSLYSDGIDDGVIMADNPLHSLNNELTIKLWIYPRTQTDNYSLVFHKGGYGNGGFVAQNSTVGTDKILFGIGSNVGWSGWASQAINYTPFSWLMATYTIKNGDFIKVYKDDSYLGQTATPAIFPTTLPLSVGKRFLPSFKGSYALLSIDNKIWDYETIKNIFNHDKSYFGL